MLLQLVDILCALCLVPNGSIILPYMVIIQQNEAIPSTLTVVYIKPHNLKQVFSHMKVIKKDEVTQ